MAKSANKRIGILGGTFDPVHKGHLKLARAALCELRLDCVYLLLSPRSPFKLSRSITPLSQRLQMLRLALRGQKKLRVGTWELRRRGPSYTVLTLSDYKRKHPMDELFLILGSDAVNGIPRWKNPKKIEELCTLVVGRRPGAPVTFPRPYKKLKGIFPAVSSTDFRRTRKLSDVPKPVASYVRRKGIYQ